MKSVLIGIYFGFVLIKSEAVSWFRIQEMFLFESFHLYGVIGSAVAIGMIVLYFIKKFSLKTSSNNTIRIDEKAKTHKASIIGGTLFGFGWALTGLCPGTIYANLFSNFLPSVLILLFAIIGASLYERIKHKLPH